MKIVFLGSDSIACPSLDAILASGSHEVCAVVTQPDRPQGRGRKVAPCAVRDHLPADLPVLTPDNINSKESLAKLATFRADLFVVVAYGQIFKPPFLAIPGTGCINLHTSLLPKYRGPAPIEWAIANGDESTGVSTMWVVPAMDEGDILMQEEVVIEDHDTGASLKSKLGEVGAGLLIKTIDMLERGELEGRAQDGSLSTYAPKISKADGKIDWQGSAKDICNRIRAFNPRPYCHCIANGQHLRVLEAKVESADTGDPGEVITWDGAGPLVRTADAAIRLLSVQPQGKKAMDGASYMRGRDRLAVFE